MMQNELKLRNGSTHVEAYVQKDAQWKLEANHTAVKSKEAQCAYFTGSAQLIRLKTMELQEEPERNWESCL